MPATVIPLERAGAWVSGVGKRMPEATKRGLFAAAHRLVGTLKVMDLPLDRGTARAGWKAERVERGAAVFNTVLQAVLMEGGVRADNVKVGRKMIDALTEWARRKGIGVRHENSAKVSRLPKKLGGSGKAYWTKTVVKVKPTDELLRSVAWAIATKMKKTGIFEPQRGGLRPLAITTRKYGPQYVREEVAREIKREFGL